MIFYTIKPQYKEIVEQEGNENVFVYRGYKCYVKRIFPFGHLCGYIVIREENQLYRMSYDEISQLYNYDLPAHGGLTFSDFVDGEYLIGFDCAHLQDERPYELNVELPTPPNPWEETYKTMAYVEGNIKEIIDHIERKGESK